jgi:nucleoside recognition membrane protein YjiH
LEGNKFSFWKVNAHMAACTGKKMQVCECTSVYVVTIWINIQANYASIFREHTLIYLPIIGIRHVIMSHCCPFADIFSKDQSSVTMGDNLKLDSNRSIMPVCIAEKKWLQYLNSLLIYKCSDSDVFFFCQFTNTRMMR